MSASKRQRTTGEIGQRVVIDVGGTKISTTVSTLERSSFLAGMIDISAWEGDPGHTAEIFLDRDPEIFSMLLRLMRQTPHIAGLMPVDPRSCASIIAEADFFGFDALLSHVKTVTYYNSRVPKDDYPKFAFLPVLPDEEERGYPHWSRSKQDHKKRCSAIDLLFAERDEAHAVAKFDEVFGSIGDALAKGVLPQLFFAPKPALLQPFTKILQLMPVEATTWLLIGDTMARRARTDPNLPLSEYPYMVDTDTLFAQPALVRRVACYALVENEASKRWVEPMIYISAADQQQWMDGAPGSSAQIVVSATLEDPTLTKKYVQTNGSRTMLASEWIEHTVGHEGFPGAFQVAAQNVWSHVLVADVPPREFGFDTDSIDHEG